MAFNIGEVLGEEGRLEEALKYYRIAYERLPLPKYKDMAKSEIEKLTNNRDILFIVTCTEKKMGRKRCSKIRYGKGGIYWFNHEEVAEESKKYPWLIFSLNMALSSRITR